MANPAERYIQQALLALGPEAKRTQQQTLTYALLLAIAELVDVIEHLPTGGD